MLITILEREGMTTTTTPLRCRLCGAIENRVHRRAGKESYIACLIVLPKTSRHSIALCQVCYLTRLLVKMGKMYFSPTISGRNFSWSYTILAHHRISLHTKYTMTTRLQSASMRSLCKNYTNFEALYLALPCRSRGSTLHDAAMVEF